MRKGRECNEAGAQKDGVQNVRAGECEIAKEQENKKQKKVSAEKCGSAKKRERKEEGEQTDGVQERERRKSGRAKCGNKRSGCTKHGNVMKLATKKPERKETDAQSKGSA